MKLNSLFYGSLKPRLKTKTTRTPADGRKRRRKHVVGPSESNYEMTAHVCVEFHAFFGEREREEWKRERERDNHNA